MADGADEGARAEQAGCFVQEALRGSGEFGMLQPGREWRNWQTRRT